MSVNEMNKKKVRKKIIQFKRVKLIEIIPFELLKFFLE